MRALTMSAGNNEDIKNILTCFVKSKMAVIVRVPRGFGTTIARSH